MSSRLKEAYYNEYMDAMTKKFGYKNVMEVPKLDKVVVNMGVGEARENAKALESAMKDMETISQDERQRLLDNLFATFSFALWCISHNQDVLTERKAIIRDLRKRVPDLWFSHGIKQLLVSSLFNDAPSVVVCDDGTGFEELNP